jgi:hypothetical protein
VRATVCVRAAAGDQLRDDGNRNFLDAQRADVQTDRRMDGVQLRPVEALALEQVQQAGRAPLRADHAEIFRHRAAQDFSQAVRIIAVSARDDRDVIALADTDPVDRVLEPVAVHRVRFGKARPVREGRTVVRHDDRKAEIGGVAAERLRDIAAAEQDQPLIRAEAAHKLRALRLEVQRRCKTVLRTFPYGLKLL